MSQEPAEPSDHSPPAALDSRRAGSTFYAFDSKSYRVLWLNAALLLAALHLAFTAYNTVAFEITGKNSSVGLVSFAIGAALLLTTPFSGAIADRVSKRLLLVLCESLILFMAVGLAALLYAEALTIGLLAVAAFLFGSGISFFWPAITACMGDVVETDKQANGAALFQIALNLTRSFAPFIGAGLLAWDAIGLGGAYVAVAIVMVLAVASVALIPRGAVKAAPVARASMLAEMKLGLQHVRANRELKVTMTTFVIVILMGFSIMVVLPAFAQEVLGAGDAGFGIMFGTHALGGLIAGLIVASRAGSPRLNTYLFLSSFAFGISIVVLAFMPSFATGLVAVLFVGAAAGAFQTLIMAAILRASAPEYFGRVMALTNIGWAMNNLFGLVLGVVADMSSERAALAGLGVALTIVSTALAWWTKRSAIAEAAVLAAAG